jgi:hypothetical protein
MPVSSGTLPFTGKTFWVDVVNGSDGNNGLTPGRAFATLYAAHSAATAGNNDVVYLIGNGAASGSARLSLANAQVWDSTATAGTLVWSKNATHLIGVTAPTGVAQRARIAPPTGTYTVTTFGSANFVTVTGAGCFFSNFSVFNGFSTGGAAQIAWTDTGGRNAYSNVDFGGMGDAGSAQDAGSRSLKVSTAGENTFVRCTVGLDTVTRTVANASLELAGGTPRNRFIECMFPFQTSSATTLGILGTGNACVDRWNSFERCVFVNNIKSTSTGMTALVSFTTASPGGLLVFKNCDTIGITKIGDTNGLANSYVSNVGGAATGGLDLNPS